MGKGKGKGKGGHQYNRYKGKRGGCGEGGGVGSGEVRGDERDQGDWEFHVSGKRAMVIGDGNNIVVDGGSYTMEEMRSMPEWERRIVTPPSSVKRKYAICFGYLGTKYQGLQINPEASTIEKELEKALFLAGGINEKNFGNLQKISWSRCARTDKGVHSLTQCCSMKLEFPLGDDEEFRQNVNKFLPEDIRVHYIQKVAKTFNSKFHCSGRRYRYFFPTYILQETSVTNAALADAQIKSARGRLATGSGTGSGSELSSREEALYAVRSTTFSGFRASAQLMEKLLLGLSQYVGTHSYHNFTSTKEAGEASARRYITSVSLSETEIDSDGMEWAYISISGQSFLLNQIRKMVTLAIEFARGSVTLDIFMNAMNPTKKVEIPMAPGLGLYLNNLYFERYNQKIEQEHERAKVASRNRAVKIAAMAAEGAVEGHGEEEENPVPTKKVRREGGEGEMIPEEATYMHSKIDWASLPEVAEKLNAFCHQCVHPHIMEEEKTTVTFGRFLDFLRVYKFDYSASAIEEKDLIVGDENIQLDDKPISLPAHCVSFDSIEIPASSRPNADPSTFADEHVPEIVLDEEPISLPAHCVSTDSIEIPAPSGSELSLISKL